jgi:integrase
MVNKKYYYFSLGYDKTMALELGDKIRGSVLLHPIEEVLVMFKTKKLMGLKDPTPKVSEVEKRCKENLIPMGISAGTLKDYMDCLKRFVRVITEDKDVESYDLGNLTDNSFKTYKIKVLNNIKDQAIIASKKRTINTKIRAIKALFNHDIYDGFDISFNEMIQSQKFYRGLKQQYRLPPIPLIKKTFNLWPKTLGDTHTLLGLALLFGLRRNEIFHCRRSWFSFTGSKARINILAEKDFKPKGGHEGYTMGDKALAKKILNKASGDDYLIKNRADYGRPAFKEALEELRAIGWQRSKPMHELRKLFGSYVASTESIYTAQKYCRHADSSTTNDLYADLIDDNTVTDLWAA